MPYLCKICNKNYITNSGFWKHNKKFHNNVQELNVQLLSTNNQLLSTNNQLLSTNDKLLSTNNQVLLSKKYKCRYCDKSYDILQSRWKHEQKCKIKDNENKQIEIDKLKYEIELFKNNSNQIITTNNNSNNNSNNNTVNNTINIVKFGTEKLNEILSENEMLKITEYINNSINQSIKMVHFNNKRPELKNIRIKNLKDKNLQIYDGKKFIIDNKYRNLYELIDNHIYNIQTFINNNKKKFNENHLVRLEKYLQLVENDAKCTINKIKYDSYYDYKVDDINTLIYNLSNNK
jgi:hypothetical protein